MQHFETREQFLANVRELTDNEQHFLEKCSRRGELGRDTPPITHDKCATARSFYHTLEIVVIEGAPKSQSRFYLAYVKEGGIPRVVAAYQSFDAILGRPARPLDESRSLAALGIVQSNKAYHQDQQRQRHEKWGAGLAVSVTGFFFAVLLAQYHSPTSKGAIVTLVAGILAATAASFIAWHTAPGILGPAWLKRSPIGCAIRGALET